jgi:very-short-patch-repair endonuclease
MAAVLAVGRVNRRDSGSMLDVWGAAVSHRTAAHLWGLMPEPDAQVDVLVVGHGGKKRRRGLLIHRSVTLTRAQVTLRARVPVTTPQRTIEDLRLASAAGLPGAVPKRELHRAIRQANVLGLPLGEEERSDRTRSDLEAGFLELCRRHHVPPPEVNVQVGRHLVDFLWSAQRVVVETDGFLYHRGREAFVDDRRRDLELKALGYEVIRVSERQLGDEPGQIAAVLLKVLGRRR